MGEKIITIVVMSGLGCLGLSALFLAISHDPNNIVWIGLAETATSAAYFLFILAFGLTIVHLIRKER